MFAFIKNTLPDGLIKKVREHYTVSSTVLKLEFYFVQYFNLSPMSLTNETKIEELRKVIELFPKVMQEVSLLSDHYDFKIC